MAARFCFQGKFVTGHFAMVGVHLVLGTITSCFVRLGRSVCHLREGRVRLLWMFRPKEVLRRIFGSETEGLNGD